MNTFGVSSKNLRPKIFSFLIYAKSMLHEFANKFYDLYITETKNWIYIYILNSRHDLEDSALGYYFSTLSTCELL